MGQVPVPFIHDMIGNGLQGIIFEHMFRRMDRSATAAVIMNQKRCRLFQPSLGGIDGTQIRVVFRKPGLIKKITAAASIGNQAGKGQIVLRNLVSPGLGVDGGSDPGPPSVFFGTEHGMDLHAVPPEQILRVQHLYGIIRISGKDQCHPAGMGKFGQPLGHPVHDIGHTQFLIQRPVHVHPVALLESIAV
jgi:hypothetical protein